MEEINKIHNLCKRLRIERYTINDDLSIDVNEDISISGYGFTKIPIKFNIVMGNFNCGDNKLTSLEGCPEYVTGNFECSFNELTSLDYAPKEVVGYFWCKYNPLPKEITDNPKEYVRAYYRNSTIDNILND